MSCEVDAHVGDTTQFTITVKDQDDVVVDISGADVLQVKLRDPSGNWSEHTATLVGDGTDGVMRYTADVAILDEAGRWKRQGYVHWSGPEQKWHGEAVAFEVKAAGTG